MTKEIEHIQLTDDELKKLICEAVTITDMQMEKEFHRFRENNICPEQLIVYLLNVAVGVAQSYIRNSIRIAKGTPREVAFYELIKALGIDNNIEVVEDTEQITKH